MIERQPIHSKEIYVVDDYMERSFYPLLIRLPRELAQIHLDAIENRDMSDEEAQEYLKNILEKRGEALTETQISDGHLREVLAQPEHMHEVMHEVETTVFQSESIGAGQTARVKRYDLEDQETTLPMAIKYLLTPTQKTLSAAAEHDMLREVERIRNIEEIEERAHVNLVHVPHPYFHHKNEKIQCYGMQLIDGVTLREVIEQETDAETLNAIAEATSSLTETILFEEFEKFFSEMHTYCLHGDIKPANIMISRSGIFYVIDFGQSVLVNDISENEREQLDNLKEDEVSGTKTALRAFLKKIAAIREKGSGD